MENPRELESKVWLSTISYTHDIAAGHMPGCGYVRKFGYNPEVVEAQETIWSAGGLYPWPDSAEVLKVSSDNADDIGNTILLSGLAGNYVRQSETIVLNGTTPVDTEYSYIRVFRAEVTSGDAADGTISVKDNANTTTLLVIDAGKGQTLMSVYTIPAGKTGFLISWYAGTSANQTVEVELYIRPFGKVFQIKSIMHIYRSPYKDTWLFPDSIPAMSDIDLRASNGVGGGSVSGGFTLWYKPE